MRAISVSKPGGPEALCLGECPSPTPRAGEVTIDVAYAGVGFVDTLLRRGTLRSPMPFIPGIEVSGHVRELGPDVSHLSPAQPVAALLNDFVNLPGAGGYAEVAVARAALTIPLQRDVDLTVAAAVPVNGATAWLAIHDLAHLQAGETVLVPGAAGGLGGLLVQIALRAGAHVIGLVSSEAKREAARHLGCHDVRTVTDIVWADAFPARGIDVVLDVVGGPTRQIAFERLAPFGRLVVLGDASGIDATFGGDTCWRETKTVQGLSLGGIAHLAPDRVANAARHVIDMVADGELSPPPIRIVPLAEAAKAHRMLEARDLTGKILLRV